MERKDYYAVTKSGRIVRVDENNERLLGDRSARVVQLVAVVFLTICATVAVLFATGLMPPTPWSPVGKIQQQQHQDRPLPWPQLPTPDQQQPPSPQFKISPPDRSV